MFTFIKNKLLHKRWLNLCILIGIILLTGIFICGQLYMDAGLKRTLQKKFSDYMRTNNQNPGVVSVSAKYIYGEDTSINSAFFGEVEKIPPKIEQTMQLPVKSTIAYRASMKGLVKGTYEKDESVWKKYMEFAGMTDLEQHIDLISGTLFGEQSCEDDVIECVVSKHTLDTYGFILGEEITFAQVNRTNDRPLKFKIVGVFKEKSEDASEPEYYWVNPVSYYEDSIFVREDFFPLLMEQVNKEQLEVKTNFFVFFDYKAVEPSNINKLIQSAELINETGGELEKVKCSCAMLNSLKAYDAEDEKLCATMWILQVPMILLLLVFIYMVSKQMLELEQNEIAMLKSRGVSKGQVVQVYLFQSSLLALAGGILGIPLGYYLCIMLGSTNSFMNFVNRTSFQIDCSALRLIAYAVLAGIVSVAFITLPVIRYAKLSIIELKQNNKNNTQPVWRKFFLDFILFAISIYYWKVFSGQEDYIAQQVISGKGTNSILFLDSSIFMLGAGLISLRIIKILVQLFFLIFKKRLPAFLYAAFMQIMRTERKYIFTSTFMILTIAMGIFHANVAATINKNSEERIRYNLGTDFILQEKWKDNLIQVRKAKTDGKQLDVAYEEPDFTKYDALRDEVESITKVIIDDRVIINYNNRKYEGNRLMAIDTKEFGETAWMKDGVLDKHWYEYLNIISQEPDAILVSKNFQKKFNAKIGEQLVYTRQDVFNRETSVHKGIIRGFIDAWPGFYINEDTEKEGKSQYLIITNYAKIVYDSGITPYEVWIKTKGNTDCIYDYLENQGKQYIKTEDANVYVTENKNSALFQATNGFLTMSYMITLLLCTVGFLIFWILSIRQRELIFGIYRAMGISMKEIIGILITEHLFSSVLSILIGSIVGIISSELFVPLIGIAYSPEKHPLPLEIVNSGQEVMKILGNISVVLVVCIIVLGFIISKFKITQALLLGED
ncbi:ABC transporter permease [Anaeromicropila populeti]|uniref:Putative ABC transport system permease protein n=1 Tax=Anaeromicropila populeti TaxID=37658 RepID=A0A1I6IX86_9FIRM|nr:FtsX-like permease family protein [Anaeromicropila populeti]SFR71354.1 putative ABC transport system permease protein [Anaeromicropila populeti]